MVQPVSSELLQSLATPTVDPQGIIKSVLAGKQIKQQQEQFQMEKEQYQRGIENDIEDRQFKRQMFDMEMSKYNTDIELKAREAMGNFAFSSLALMDDNPKNFMENFSTLRDQAPRGVREQIPQGFNSVQEARNWATTQAAQTEKLIPYLQLKKQGQSEAQWKLTTAILSKEPEELTGAEQRYLDYFGQKDTNIYLTPPSKAKTQDAISFLGALTHPDGESILDSMDSKSRLAYISAVSNLTDQLMATSAKQRNPIDRSTAMTMAADQLYSKIQPTESLIKEIPVVGKYFKNQYAFVPEVKAQARLDQAAQQNVQQEGPKITIKGGYMWDMSTTPPTNLGKAK